MAFSWCELGSDKAPWDRLAPPQLTQPRRGLHDYAELSAAAIPAIVADVDSELSAAQLSQILVMHDVGDGSQAGF